ncbi:MAG: T9SS type A sorting domain-containing protein [Ignavibacteriae bacterium]|nr:T9SS type A sorting domain-containing protein [Ignavibacteriota bacterium]
MGTDNNKITALGHYASKTVNLLYAGTDDPTHANIYKSTDKGESWTTVYTTSDGTIIRDIKVNNLLTATVYAATSSGVVKTTNGGTSWTFMNNGLGDLDVRAIYPDPNTNNLVYAGTASKFYYSSDGGSNWIDASTGADIVTTGGMAVYNDDVYTIAGTQTAILASKLASGGTNWQILSKQYLGPSNFAGTDMVIDYSNPNQLYTVGRQGNNLTILQSTNGGQTWVSGHTHVGANGASFNAVAIDPNSSSRVYAVSHWDRIGNGYTAEFWFTTNNGVTWNTPVPRSYSADYYAVAYDKNSGTPSQVLYAGGWQVLNDLGGRLANPSIHKSTDGGNTWSVTILPGLNRWVSSFAIDPVNPQVVYASAGVVVSGTGTIFKTTNGGTGWTALANLPSTGNLHRIYSLVHDPKHSNILYMAEEADPNVWKISMTADGGQSWSVLSNGIPSNVKINHLAFKSNLATGEHPQYLYAATDAGVYKIDLNSTLNSNVLVEWNMLSVPDVVNNFTKTTVWPTSISDASRFDPTCQCYVISPTLQNGPGYWIKFPSAQSVSYTGWAFNSYTMNVTAGWNLIGSISNLVQTSSIIQNPPGNVISSFFKYNQGYVQTTQIDPGLGIWVNVAQNGTLTLVNSSAKIESGENQYATYDKFTITDSYDHKQDLYVRNSALYFSKGESFDELPPPPPDSAFSAGFKTNHYVENVHPSKGSTPLNISVRGAAYPITLSWDIKSTNGIKYNFPKDINKGTTALTGTGRIILDSPNGKFIQLIAEAGEGTLPLTYLLKQNHPNPFNPTTTINYQLSEDIHVNLKIFNTLGQEVATLVDEVQSAGYKTARFEAGSLPSGVYFYRLTAVPLSGSGQAFTDIKKMLLAR